MLNLNKIMKDLRGLKMTKCGYCLLEIEVPIEHIVVDKDTNLEYHADCYARLKEEQKQRSARA